MKERYTWRESDSNCKHFESNQTVPTGTSRKIEGKHRDPIANLGFFNHNLAIQIDKQ